MDNCDFPAGIPDPELPEFSFEQATKRNDKKAMPAVAASHLVVVFITVKFLSRIVAEDLELINY
jgi:hypothetical protein